ITKSRHSTPFLSSLCTPAVTLQLPGAESFQPFLYRDKQTRAFSIDSYGYAHHRPVSHHFASRLPKHVLDIKNRVVILLRGSHSDREQYSSQQVIGLESNETLPTGFQRVEHSLQGLDRLRKEMEGS